MGLGPDALHAGRRGRMSGRWPDVRAFPRCRMSGRWGRMSGLAGSNLVALWNGWVWISGQEAGCPGARDAPDVRAGARCPAAEALGLLLVQILGGCTGAECPVTVASASPSSSVVASRLPSRMV